MRTKFVNSIIFVVTSLSCILVLEIASRYVMSISAGTQALDVAGNSLQIYQEDSLRLRGPAIYRQVSDEFDVITTISDKGFRVPATSNPTVIFLGDSFTFGTGLSDTQSIPSVFCKELSIDCVNMGRPGTGTGHQVDLLEQVLSLEEWKPKLVFLLIFAMDGVSSAGNDFTDNILYRLQKKRAGFDQESKSQQYTRTFSQYLLEKFNLARIVKFFIGPQLRSIWSRELSGDAIIDVRAEMEKHLSKLDSLSRKFGFDYQIVLLHPMQDHMRGTAAHTLRVITGLSKGKNVISTVDVFKDTPSRYYFAYDGHFNKFGAEAVAKKLIDEYSRGSSSNR
jgi:hypothetical protein